MVRKSALWEVSDPLWERLSRILEERDPRLSKGRPRSDPRRILDGIIFKVRTGCRWNRIPKVYGSDTTVYRSLQRWSALGLWPELLAVLSVDFPELAAYDWKLQPFETPDAENP